nr:Chain BP, 50S ribosomal protein L19 [Thermus thermophilus HB27]4V83_DP Chain DP, 50S ribosomal protein L19 [Thermus thermophilus HB27]4V84_BP Chain BP, 50S ribosomal protein L19 [Thermus thermophilus HB27]4V84_DP Chain DP, 50S ribosomal protein L19 [Thermus thermophilus HB27]4V9N_BT Chain BT, 50S ribosomal protein L19 [Thermus thermophilus HB27]4V9N_DT Chain DT, 50S ribosomal protein L19 [Thermus thermophilus HB27]4V9Q_AP Chain AP, 50S ribosomal protein L19 [Thermus thermophilus HB27]4V9Q
MNRGALIKLVESRYVRTDLPEFRPGDTVRVSYKVKEGNRTRIQDFEGIVIRIRRNGFNTTFTVRKVSYGVGVERIFPLHSPLIQKIDIVQRGRARRAKLYFIRNLSDREIRRKLRADRKRIDKDRAAERAAKEEVQK